MRWLKRTAKILGYAILFGGFFIFGIVFGFASSLVQDDPVRSQDEILKQIVQNSTTGFVYFNDGTEIGQLRGIDKRIVPLSDIPVFVRNAFLSIEDNNFYSHPGIDLWATARAFKQKLLNESVQTGGSTITQQVARNYFLNLDRTSSRKVKEIFLALRLERFLTKDQILQAYLNRVPFGNGSTGYNVYGVKSAAIGIFNISDLSKLNIAQAAYLAGLPQSPSAYSAFNGLGGFSENGFNRARVRQKLVLKRMYEEKNISDKQYKDALAFNIRKSLAKPGSKAYSTYPYLMVEIEKRAAELLILKQNPSMTLAQLHLPENQKMIDNAVASMLEKGYQIYTTIDKKVYTNMQKIAANPKNFTPNANANGLTEQIGAVMLNNKSGAILGMIEGRDFNLSQYNHATQAQRQPGSTMKTIAAYLPALDSGAIQPGSILDDSPLVLQDGSKGSHIPNNWNTQYQGLITARTALNQSYNIPALYLFNNVVGISNAWSFAKKLGITTLTKADDTAQTGVIGGLTNGVTVEEMTNAYAAIPNKGNFVDAYLIERIVDGKGNDVYKHHVVARKVFEPETAYLMTSMLKTVVTAGTAQTLRLHFKYLDKVPVAGKTGSTQKDRDAWFMGFTPDITLGVWAGYDKDNTLTTYSTLPQGAGIQRAKNVWSLVMNSVYENEPALLKSKKFSTPKKIKTITVSNISGFLPSDPVKAKGLVHSDLFNLKYIPVAEDTQYVNVPYIRVAGLNYSPNELTPSDFVKSGWLYKTGNALTATLSEISKLLKSYSPENRPMKTKTIPMRLTDYYPRDAALRAPTQVDPRKEDGNMPDAPTSVVVKPISTKQTRITFHASKAKDVVGYRLFCATANDDYVYVKGHNVWSYQPKVITVPRIKGAKYKVVAVDVSGNTSE